MVELFPTPAFAQLKKLADLAADAGGMAGGRPQDEAAYWWGVLEPGDVLNEGKTIIYANPQRDSDNFWSYVVGNERVYMP